MQKNTEASKTKLKPGHWIEHPTEILNGPKDLEELYRLDKEFQQKNRGGESEPRVRPPQA